MIVLSGFFLTLTDVHAQKKKWSKPVAVTEMNGGQISVCYSLSHPDSISYKIHSLCSGLKNVYTCFAFKYLDRNLIERTHIVRDISLAAPSKKEYHVYTKNGIIKIVQPFLKETVVAYVNDFKIDAEADSQKSRPE